MINFILEVQQVLDGKPQNTHMSKKTQNLKTLEHPLCACHVKY